MNEIRRSRTGARSLAALLAAAASPAIAAGGPLKCPEKGGPKWRELTTAHFVVKTNLGEKDARAAAARLERLRAGLLRGISRAAVDPPGRIEVVIPRTRDFEGLVGSGRVRIAGWFDGNEFEPRLVLNGGHEDTVLPAHELAHYLIAYNFGRFPRWLNEGLAAYFETIEIDARKDGVVVAQVGRPPKQGVLIVARRHMVTAREARIPVVAAAGKFFKWGTEPITYDLERIDMYATAWAATHYLVNRQPAAFSGLLGRLARGEDPAQAWRAVFPQFDPDTRAGAKAWEETLEHYIQGGEYSYLRFEVTPDVAVSSERELPEDEIHALWASLILNSGGRTKDVQAELAEAVKAVSGSAHALWVERSSRPANAAPAPAAPASSGVGAEGGAPAPSGAGPGAGAARERAAIAASPESWRAWVMLADAESEPWPERAAAYERATQLAPDNAGVLNAHAWALLERGDSVPALPLAVRAARAAPWSPPVLDTLAAVLADLGRACEAVPVQQRAVELLPDNVDEARASSYRERAEAIQAQCRATKI